MALEIFKKYREALGLSRYKVAKDLGYGVSKGKEVRQIEETAKTVKWAVVKYFIKMGKDLGKTDKQIVKDILNEEAK